MGFAFDGGQRVVADCGLEAAGGRAHGRFRPIVDGGQLWHAHLMQAGRKAILRRWAVTTAATVMALAVILGGFEVYFVQRQRQYSRTVERRQFKSDARSYEMSLQAIRRFETRHTLDPEKNGGLRVYMDEWPAWKYLISFQMTNDGSLKGGILALPYDGKGALYERDFKVPEWQARVFLSSFDRQIDSFGGAYTGCTDGTHYQYERWQHQRVSSGVGNAACQLHYAELEALVAETLVMELRDAPFDWRGWFDDRRLVIMAGKGQ